MGAWDTYNSSATNARDISEMVVNISPKDSPFFSMISSGVMTARYKENVTDATAGGTAINAMYEGDTFTDDTIVNRGTNGNYSQIFSRTIAVTDTQETVAKYGGVKSEIQYQVKKKFEELAKDVEYSYINGTATAGIALTATSTATSARKLGGLLTKISTNTATASGAAATASALESTLNNLIQTMYEAGVVPDTILVEGTVKRRLSALTANVTRNVDAERKTQIASINIYDSDFGTVNIVLDRYIPSTKMVALALEYFKTAYLRKFKKVPLAKTTDSTRVAIVGELTLDVLEEKAGGMVTFS